MHHKEFLQTKSDVKLDMTIREPKVKFEKLHPEKQYWVERTTQAPLPLTYKLQDVEVPHGYFPQLETRTPDLPFYIERTKSGNLPVYRDYKCKRSRKMTEIRLITGDINAFCDELSKIASNHKINPKVGRIVVNGLHKNVICNWLYRLGF